MSMAYIRSTYGVPAKRGMAVRVKVGRNKGTRGVIRRAHFGNLIVTDTPGKYGWRAVIHPDDLEYLTQQTEGRP